MPKNKNPELQSKVLLSFQFCKFDAISVFKLLEYIEWPLIQALDYSSRAIRSLKMLGQGGKAILWKGIPASLQTKSLIFSYKSEKIRLILKYFRLSVLLKNKTTLSRDLRNGYR